MQPEINSNALINMTVLTSKFITLSKERDLYLKTLYFLKSYCYLLFDF